MEEYLRNFLEMFDYPEASRPVLCDAYTRICNDARWGERYQDLMRRYAGNKDCDYKLLAEDMAEISQAAGIHRYTGQLLMYICLSRQLREFYREAWIAESVWLDSMMDLKYKLLECKAVYGIWGTFTNWFDKFFTLNRFAMGRLQYEMSTLNRDYSKHGVTLNPQSKVLGVHIPRTLTRLDRQSVEASFAQADRFFRDWFAGEPTVFACGSWLLFPRHRQMLPPESNIVGFMDRFDIIDHGFSKDYSEVWRLFDCLYTPELDKMPQDSTLRRAYVDLMRRGEKTGWGFGVCVYSGC